jgi:hypothetical protein
LINAGGVLNKWKWPAINGREMFKGPMLHGANWDDLVALKGKKVAVIGGDSSRTSNRYSGPCNASSAAHHGSSRVLDSALLW